MKAIFLNTWAGRTYEPLMEYLGSSAADTDFFCLQEVFDSPEDRPVSWGGRANIYAHIKRALGDFVPFYAVAARDHDGDLPTGYPLSHGIAIFVKKHIKVLSHGDMSVAGEAWHTRQDRAVFPHKLQYARFLHRGLPHTIANVHGVAHPGNKLDTDVRLEQSRRIAEFLAGETGEKILGGDFNLMPETESIRMIERSGMKNLIAEYGITTTRSRLSYAQYPEDRRQYFADFIFVSPGVRLTRFAVPEMEISDHLPLVIEWQ